MDAAASLGRAATPDNSDAKSEQAQKQSGGSVPSGGITPSPGQQAQLSTASSGAVAASRARNISQMTDYEKFLWDEVTVINVHANSDWWSWCWSRTHGWWWRRHAVSKGVK